ncbi:HelD family protein [Actinoplanes sp. CA-142083]|uniref:HelD family protein n=1 Tax=Actinoplanes sp. CA-142083 TaxID=3239903 RepID=UPI003D918112
MGAVSEQALVAHMYERLDAETAEVLEELGGWRGGERTAESRGQRRGERAAEPRGQQRGEHATEPRGQQRGEWDVQSGGLPDPDRAVLLRKRLVELRAAEDGLVFGRIDRVDGSSLHIGRRGIRVDGEPLLVDWRAPAAAPFYAATAARPMGLRRRRHLRLDGRRVVSVADEILDGSAPGPDDVVGDGPLAEALAAPRTGRMADAVTTLQAEQDEIVRSPYRGITVVQGGPGTGKTVVALHRAAYVLFAFPATAERGVLVVGPDARFLEYISQVLPSLGENDVRLATRTGITEVAPGSSEPAGVARAKGQAKVAELLAEIVAARRPGVAAIRLPVGAETFAVGEDAMAGAIAAAAGMPHNAGREAFKEYLVAELVRLRARRTAETLERIDAETAALTGVDLDAAVAADLRSLGFADEAPRRTASAGHDKTPQSPAGPEQRKLADPEPDPEPPEPDPEPEGTARRLADLEAEPEGTARRLADLEAEPDGTARRLADLELGDSRAARAAIAADARLDEAIERLWPRLTPDQVVAGLLDAPPPGWEALRREPGGGWTAADLALLDEAAELVEGTPADVYGHIVVDEAQELTEMDWRVVLRRCPSRSMTVVGDFAQAGSGSTVTGWREAVGERFELHTLTINYRTTAEILDYSRDLLAEIAPSQRLSRSLRHGEKPLIAPEELTVTPGELVAVICPDDLVVAGGIPVSKSRGLEFDTVIVVAPDRFPRRDLYVALTRATRRLVIVERPEALPRRR